MQIKNSKIVFFSAIFLAFLSSALLMGRVFVYDASITHFGLTKLAGELYNKTGKNQLTSQEISWLSQGAVEEDTPLRWMNHFYDPVNNRGLEGMYDSAKVWAKDYNEQPGYARGNNTWAEALYQYQKGNKEKAFIALGHVLHLLEDMTVPAHTRNDAHPEGDPYEVWTRQNFHAVDAQMIDYNNLEAYFDYLANFSNNNFFSKDTIGVYLQPSLNESKVNDDCIYSNGHILVCFVIDDLSGKKLYYFDSIVAKDYFSILAPKAIGAGAGVIKLFFEEAQKPQKYDRPFWQITLAGIIQQQTAGAVVPMAGKIKDRTTDAFNEVVNSGQELIYDITNASNIWDFVSDLWKTNTALAMDFKDLGEMKNNLVLSPVKMAGQAVETLKDAFGSSASSEQVYQILRNLDASGSSISYAPKTTSNLTDSSEPSLDINDIFFLSEPTSPMVLAAAQNSNSTVLAYSWSGGSSYSGSGGTSASSGNNYSSQNNQEVVMEGVDEEEDSIEEGESSLENSPVDESANTSVTSTSETTTTSTLEIIDPTTSTSTVNATSTADGDSENTEDTEDVDEEEADETEPAEENEEETEEESAEPEDSLATDGQIIISEIAWGGTQAAANDEWLELYNASNFDVDVSGWVLTDGNDIDFVFSSSTIIESGEYFLMERTNDNTISNHQADLIYTGSLRDGGEKLTLKNSAGIVFDEVDCSARWFAGRNAYDTETMERKNFSASGSDASNWQITPMAVWRGKDAKGNYIAGTPGSPNSATIYLNGELTASRTLSSGTYVLGFLSIPVGKTLTINSGVEIIGGLASNIKVSGKLEILGTADNPVVFTSYKDVGSTTDFYLQDANWGYIQVLSGGEANIQNTRFNFGNSKLDNARPKGLIYADNAVLSLDGVIFDKNLNERPRGDWPLINSLNSDLEIKDSSFSDSPKGLVVKGGNLNLSGSTFEDLGLSALESEDVTTAVIEDNTFKDLGWEYMKRNYWERPYPLLSPVSFKNFLPESIKDNTFENNILNSWEVFGRLISGGKIDTLGEAPAIMGLLEIPAGMTLEVKEGSIVKVLENYSLKVFGSLLSRGTLSNQVIFTSLHDDEYGGDVDLAEQRLTQKEGNEWTQILIQTEEPSVIDNTLVRFANAATAANKEGSIFVGGAPFLANNLTIEFSRVPSVALHLKDGTGAVINGCLIKNETKRMFDPSVYTDGSGIWINGGNPQISNCVIDTFNFGLRLNPESSPELSNIDYKNVDFETGW